MYTRNLLVAGGQSFIMATVVDNVRGAVRLGQSGHESEGENVVMFVVH